jgi:hypothetical protein
MNQQDIVNRLCKIKDEVKTALRKNGVVAPIKTSRGIKLEDYEIVLENNIYKIYNRWGEVEVHSINYLQTAVLLANSMALKKTPKINILSEDMQAGSAEFDCKLFEHRFKKSLRDNDVFGIQHYSVRLAETKRKYKQHFSTIENQYQRLLRTFQVPSKTNK